MEEIAPEWPLKMTREERKLATQRRKDFDAAFKKRAKGTGWRYREGSIFRKTDDWFLASTPHLTWKEGINHELMIKPMALDTLFWKIVDLPENEELPLSFRENGAWVLRPPKITQFVKPKKNDPIELANLAFEWTETWCSQNIASYELDDMLDRLKPLEKTQSHLRSVAICLLILKKEFKQASILINDHPDDSGGFSIAIKRTFYDMVKDWLVNNDST